MKNTPRTLFGNKLRKIERSASLPSAVIKRRRSGESNRMSTTSDALPTALPTSSRWEQRELDCHLRILLSKEGHDPNGFGSGGGGVWEHGGETAAAAAEAVEAVEAMESVEAATRCPVSWDMVHCWPSSPAGALAVAPCMDELNGVFYDTSQNATRWCFANGTWDNYSNYSQCEELVPTPPPSDAATTTAIFFVGFCLSLLALGVAIWIFLYFKDLRCLRNTIHTNLMWTYIFFDAMWILNACVQGFAGNFVSCVFLVVLIHYFYLTNFFWMFVEGLYLFMLVVATFTSEKIKLRVYLIIGWGIPAVIVVTWAIAKHFSQPTTSEILVDPRDERLLMSHCPLMAPDGYDWIHQAPVITVLAMNLVFLVSIMWVLITKLRSANTAETKQYRKATKALLVLFPLLGITYILMMQGPMEGWAGNLFRDLRALLVGLQGFTVALFYCFLNTEVQNTLRHRLGRWREARAVGGGRRYTLSGHSKDWSPRSRTESIRLGDVASGGSLLTPAYRKRESTASQATTTTLLGPGQLGNGRLSDGAGAARVTCPRLLAEENAV